MPEKIAGHCRICEKPLDRGSAHESCKDEWSTWNDPARARLATFERDNYRCVDCGRPGTEDTLHADHDTPVWLCAQLGIEPNDPSNYATRCRTPCHADKTARENRAHNSKGARRMAAPTIIDRPSGVGAFRASIIGIIPCAAIAALTYGISALYPPAITYTEWALAGALAWVGLVVLLHRGRVRRFVKAQEAQRVGDKLRKVTKDNPLTGRMRVHQWERGVPVEVTLFYGASFNEDDKDALTELARAFARAVGVEKNMVQIDATRGRARLRVTDGAHAGEPEPEVEPDNKQRKRLQAALRGIIDDEGELSVLDAHKDGSPREYVFTYPARAAARASDVRAQITETVRDMFPAHGVWFIDWQPRKDRFHIEDRPDPLARIVTPAQLDAHPDLARGITLGIRDDGQPWVQPIIGRHLLVSGESGSGKSAGVLWSLIRGLLPHVTAGTVRLWVCDPKGGMELGFLEPVAYRYYGASEDPDKELVAFLAGFRKALSAQTANLADVKIRKLETPTREFPLNVLVIDEIANLTAYLADSKARAAVASHLNMGLSQGRAAGFAVIGALQDPRAKVIDMRKLFTDAIALKVGEASEVDMILGRGARARGAVADLIPKTMRGVGYAVSDEDQDPVRVRAAYVTDDEIDRVIAVATGKPAPEHGDPVKQEEAPTLPLDEPEPELEPHPVAARLIEKDRFQFDGDPDVATLLADPEPHDEHDDRVVLTYRYDDNPMARETDVDRDEIVTRMP